MAIRTRAEYELEIMSALRDLTAEELKGVRQAAFILDGFLVHQCGLASDEIIDLLNLADRVLRERGITI